VGVDENNKRAVELEYKRLDNIEDEDERRRALDHFYGLTEELPSDEQLAEFDRVQTMDDTPNTQVRASCAADSPTDGSVPAKPCSRTDRPRGEDPRTAPLLQSTNAGYHARCPETLVETCRNDNEIAQPSLRSLTTAHRSSSRRSELNTTAATYRRLD
ncbi:hypothetical protein THAOC_08805, partial [Thalassiosira oceanica]